MNDYIPQIPDLAPGEMPYADDWNLVKEAACRPIPMEFIDVPRGNDSSSSQRCTALLAGAMAATNSTRTVDHVVPIDDSASPVSSDTDTLTVYNTLRDAGPDNAVCRIEYNRATSQWEFYRVMAFDVRWDSTNDLLQKSDDGAQTWITVDTPEAC